MTRIPVRCATARPGRRYRRLSRARAAVVAAAGLACLLTVSACATGAPRPAPSSHPPAAAAPPATTAAIAPKPKIVPKPVHMTAGPGRFTLTRATRIVVASGLPSTWAVARDLAAYLKPATGYPLPVTGGTPHPGDIALVQGQQAHLTKDPHGEAYTLDTAPGSVKLAAGTAHGLYDAVQTLRQMFPAWIDSPTRRPGPWSVPAEQISDHPRYGYRGLMLDIARHYEPPSAVEELINQAAAYKIDVLHLHLSDDQGFRLVINGFPRLAKVGGRGSVGTHGRTRGSRRLLDPGAVPGRGGRRGRALHDRGAGGGLARPQQRDPDVGVLRHAQPEAARPAQHRLRPERPAEVELHRGRRLQRAVPGQQEHLGHHERDHRPAHRAVTGPVLRHGRRRGPQHAAKPGPVRRVRQP